MSMSTIRAAWRVTYCDFRNDVTGDDGLSTDLWITHSHDEGQTFSDESRVTLPSFDMRTAPDALGYSVGDYTGLAHLGSTFHAGWVGANDGNTAIRLMFSTAWRSERAALRSGMYCG